MTDPAGPGKAETAAAAVVGGRMTTVIVALADLKAVVDRVYEADPTILARSQVVIGQREAFIWLPARPRTPIHVVARRPIKPPDLAAIPAPASLVGGAPTALGFWRSEVLDRRNTAAWLVSGVALAAGAWAKGGEVTQAVAGPLALFFAVWLPVLPLFFGPASQGRLAAFFASGRLAKWQTTDIQMFAAACVGFVLSLATQALADPASDPIPLALAWFLAILLAAWIAVWVLICVLGYALPVRHAVETARAAQEWLEDKGGADATRAD